MKKWIVCLAILLLFRQAAAQEKIIPIGVRISIYLDKYRSPGPPMIYSSLLSGLGQISQGRYLQGLLFLGVEAFAWYSYHKETISPANFVGITLTSRIISIIEFGTSYTKENNMWRTKLLLTLPHVFRENGLDPKLLE